MAAVTNPVDEVAEHPLQNSWSFWEHRTGSGNEYGSNMHQLGDFKTVEEFWRYFNNIPKVNDVFYTSSGGRKHFADRAVDGFSLFKSGIRPEWEDPQNMRGGEYFVRKNFNARDLNEYWELMCLGLIGETIDPSDEVCGARIVDKTRGDRPMYRLEIWFKSQDTGIAENIKSRVAGVLGSSMISDYKPHSQSVEHLNAGRGR